MQGKRFDPVARFHQFSSAWEADPFLARLQKAEVFSGRFRKQRATAH